MANLSPAAIRFVSGDLPGAWAAQAAGRRQVERFGSMYPVRHLEGELVIEEYLRGEWDAAEQHASRFLDTSETSAHFMDAACRIVRGQIRIGRGDLAGAREDAERALEAGIRTGMEMERDVRAFAARVAAAAGFPDDAEAEARAALALWSAFAFTPPCWDAVQLAFVSVELGAAELFISAVDSGPRNPWIDAARTFASGDAEAAAAALDRIGSVPDAMYARLGSANPAELEQALAFYRGVDAVAYAAEAERRIAAVRPGG